MLSSFVGWYSIHHRFRETRLLEVQCLRHTFTLLDELCDGLGDIGFGRFDVTGQVAFTAEASCLETERSSISREAVELVDDFELFAAFGMGTTGKASRVWSLKEGANLTYGSIGEAKAPGQVDVLKMKKAMDELENLPSPFETANFLSKF